MNPLEDKTSYIQAFRQSAPYINAHRQKTCVILIDGETLASPYITNITHDIALLNTLGVKVVLVYGTRPQIDKALASQSIASEFHQGKRITKSDTLALIKHVSGNSRIELESLFSHGLPNTPMHGANIRITSGNFVTAKPLGVIDGCDFQFTGGVRKIDTVAINALLDAGSVVLLSNIGYSSTGECFNLSAEDVAVATAQSLQADKLLVYTNAKTVSALPRELMLKQAKTLVGSLEKANQHSLNCLINACEAGINRSHLIAYDQDGSLLLELFTTDGVGTLLSLNPFESIRPATINDVSGILELLEPLESQGILVKRDRELLEQEISHFIVTERDGMVIGCSALYPFSDTSGEIACVASHPEYSGSKRGMQMLGYLEKSAKESGLTELFVLTTQSAHFFLEQGYTESSVDSLPDAKQALYNYQRNSKVFKKTI